MKPIIIAIATAAVLASSGADASDASVCNDLAAYQVAAEITGTDECAMEAIWAGANGETVSAKCIALGEVDKAMVRKEHECMVSLGTKKEVLAFRAAHLRHSPWHQLQARRTDGSPMRQWISIRGPGGLRFGREDLLAWRRPPSCRRKKCLPAIRRLRKFVAERALTVLRRLAKSGAVVKSGTSRNARWALALLL